MGVPKLAVSPLLVRDVMTSNVLTTTPQDDVRVASHMLECGSFHHLPVVHEGAVVGVVTARELQRRRATEGDRRVTVREVMVEHVLTTAPAVLVNDAADEMARAQVSCLPVVEDGQLVGILTTTDVLGSSARLRLVLGGGARGSARGESRDGAPGTVGDVMSPAPHTVLATTKLDHALALMQEHRVRHLPVVDEAGVLSGMLSDRDVRTAVGDPLVALCEGNDGVAADLTVADVMGAGAVVLARPDEPLAVLAWGFLDQRVGAVPVVDEGGRVVGIVSYVDLLRRTLGNASR